MPSSIVIAGTSLVVAAGLYKLFRRPAPRLTDKDLDDIPGIPSNVRIVQTLGNKEHQGVKEAFLKGNDFQWIVAGDELTKIDFENKDVNASDEQKVAQAKHKAVTDYMLECVIRFAELYAHILVVTENPRSDPNPGKILGVLALVPPYRSQRLCTLHFFRAVIPLGMPVTNSMGGGAQERFDARFDAFTSQVPEKHHQVMCNTPHWYVLTLGVFKDTQGKGVGTKLLQTAKAFAGNKPLYLECHNDNVAYYKKMGYTHAKQYKFDVKEDKANTSTLAYSYNCMVYEGSE